ncbi:MAG TPA: hypothetical protein VD833_06815 [Vicinamibacterales bacterium]|nr:hypothetical protein [Vicinamibacterales bacterium]
MKAAHVRRSSRFPLHLTVLGLAGLLVAPLFAQAPEQPAAPQPSAEQAAQPAAPSLTDEQIEKFLTTARVTRTKGISKGVTNSVRVTLSDGTLTHDAHVQVIDERKTSGPSAGGTEMNFRDSWVFNIAAYKLDRLIGMNLVPVSVERRHKTQPAAFTWWVDDVQMDEGERLKRKATSPLPAQWNEQMQMVRVFDQLIYNMDRNLGNLLITKDWQVWAIDHTRAFRLHKELKAPENITRCDRQMYERLKQLDKATLTRAMGNHLASWEIDAILARRDAIIARLDQGGPGALFDRRDGRGVNNAVAASASAVR